MQFNLQSFNLSYVPLASQNPYSIIVCLVTLGKCNLRDPNLVIFCLCICLIKPFNQVFLKWFDEFVKLNAVEIFPLLNPYQPEFYNPENPKNVQSHSGNSIETATTL